MLLTEMIKLFLASRKRGMSGAKRQAAPKTLRYYQQNLTIVLDYFQERGVVRYGELRKLVLLDLFDWIDKKVEMKEWSVATKLCVLGCLRTFFKWVAKDEDCIDAECKPGLEKYLPPIPKKPRRLNIPASVDVKQFKGAFNTSTRWGIRNFTITCLVIDTGLRAGEVCSLRLDGAKLEECQLYVIGKTGPRTVPMSKDMSRILKAWLRKRVECTQASDSPFVFVSKYAPQMTAEAIRKMVEAHRNKHGLGKFSAHSFRHFYATHYLRNGGDMERLRNNMGHATYEMLKGYLHVAEIGSKEAQQEIERVSPLKGL